VARGAARFPEEVGDIAGAREDLGSAGGDNMPAVGAAAATAAARSSANMAPDTTLENEEYRKCLMDCFH
jgi:hypothetical protein